jgi:hypothetical protein
VTTLPLSPAPGSPEAQARATATFELASLAAVIGTVEHKSWPFNRVAAWERLHELERLLFGEE